MIHKSLFQKIIILLFVYQTLCESYDGNKNVMDVQSLTLYNNWKTQNQRIFINDEEKIYRQLVFFDNLKKINENNSDPENTYKMILTQFSDMTDEEFAEKILNQEMISPQDDKLSIKPSNINEQILQSLKKNENEEIINIIDPASVLTSINWRAKGAVTPVKDQGTCESSWAFSAAAVMESFNYIKNNRLRFFSEQQLVDCANNTLGYGSYGCRGGWPQHGIDYSTRYGILESYQYAYTGITGTCRITAPTSGFYPISYKRVSNTVLGLKKALNFSPVSVAVDGSKFKQYGSGVFNGCTSTVRLSHALLAVGYDSDGNWILKNSWGSRWGEYGYMRLRAGNSCGILSSNFQITE